MRLTLKKNNAMPEPTKFNYRLNNESEKLFARSNGELGELIAALQKVNRELSDARRAALNVMEDAILSKEALSKSEEKYRLKLEQEVRERTAELKASQEQYASLVENTPDIITRWNKDLQLIFANSAYAQTTGVSNAGLYGRTYLEIGQPVAIAVPYMDSLRKVFETGEPVEHFNSLSTSQGEVSYYARIVPEKNEEGNVETVLSIARDITAYTKANEQIREQTHYIKRITETVPDMISVTNLETKEFIYLNKDTFRSQGFDPAEMDALSPEERIEYVHPNDRPFLAEYFEKLSTALDDDVITLEYRAKGSSGRWNWFLVRGRVFQRNETGAVTHVLNVIGNITDSKQAEYEVLRLKDEVAQKATDKYLRLYNAIDEAFCLLEVMYNEQGEMYDMRFLDVNPAVEKQLAIKVEAGKTFSDYPNLDINKFQQCADVVRTGVPVRFIDHSGATNRWFEYHVVRTSKADRQVGLLFNDITEHKRNEQNHALLSEISQELFGLSSITEAMGRLGEKIAKHFGITQCTFVELSDDGEVAIATDGWNVPGSHALTGTYRTRDFLSGEQIAASMAGQPTIVDDTQNDERVNAGNYSALGIRSFIINPVTRDNLWKFMIAVIDNKPRHWREDEIDLAREITGRIWTRLERARAEQALRESEAKLKATMDSAADYAIITMNTERKIERWNTGAEKIFGYTAEEITGEPADMIFTPDDKANNVPQKEMETARDAGKANDERWHLRKDGSRVFMSGVMAPIYESSLTGYVKVARDITERQLMEQQKDEFITIASHELKTPATTIKAYAEYLNEIVEEQGNEEMKEPVAKLNTQVDRLISLIHSLLDTTRIAEGQLKLNPVKFDLITLVTEQVEALQRTTHKHRIVLNIPESSAIITADREKVAQVLANLVSNAIKYSPQKGEIKITLAKTREGLQISVQDQGIGIPKQSLDKIFGRFYRVRNPQVDTFPGMGLGLYIAASIIQQHGGKIWVESQANKGTTFYFLLPYN
jgi:PAS domain S-box-containing protein